MASKGSANPHKMASKGSAASSKSAPKGSAGPLKTAASKDNLSSLRRSPTKVRVDGVLVDVKGFSQAPRPQAKSSRQSKAERNLVLFNQYSAWQMMKWNRHQFFKAEIMVYLII